MIDELDERQKATVEWLEKIASGACNCLLEPPTICRHEMADIALELMGVYDDEDEE